MARLQRRRSVREPTERHADCRFARFAGLVAASGGCRWHPSVPGGSSHHGSGAVQRDHGERKRCEGHGARPRLLTDYNAAPRSARGGGSRRPRSRRTTSIAQCKPRSPTCTCTHMQARPMSRSLRADGDDAVDAESAPMAAAEMPPAARGGRCQLPGAGTRRGHLGWQGRSALPHFLRAFPLAKGGWQQCVNIKCQWQVSANQ